MTDGFAPAPGAGDPRGERAMSRLADRIAAMAPPPTVLELTDPMPPKPRPSPAVAAALSRTAAVTAAAEQRALNPNCPRSMVALAVDGFVAACACVPYALVALVLRVVMAREFFLDGQARIDGPHFAYSLHGFNFSIVLPLQVKAETFTALLSHYVAVPISPAFAAYLVSGAEFLLPIMLVLGFGARFAALGLMLVTALIQLFVQPDALWTAHIYWAAILLVLLARGPGTVSFDHIIRLLGRR